MKISKADEGVLTIALAEKIQNSSITNYNYAPVGQGWEAQIHNDLSPEFSKSIRTKIDGSLEGFFQDRVFSVFFRNGNKTPTKSEDNKPLISFHGFSDPLALAQEFVSYLKSVPIQYACVTPLNRSLSEEIGKFGDQFNISNQLIIKKGSCLLVDITLSADTEDYTNYLTRQALYDGSKIKIDEDGYYFLFRHSGYIGRRYDCSIISDMSDQIKAFYGCLISSGFAYYDYIFSKPSLRPFILVNKIENGQYVLNSAMGSDDDLRLCLDLYLTNEGRKSFGSPTGIDNFLDAPIKMFASKESHRLITASTWLLRAYLSERDMDQILFSAIAVEALLGDRDASDRVGLSKLMANRCAYALGKSGSDRHEIMEFFVNWYKVRSEIVHSGRMHVSKEERKIVNKGKYLASRLLNHEINMLSGKET